MSEVVNKSFEYSEDEKLGYYIWAYKPFCELKKGDYIYECPYRGRFANTKKPPFTVTDVKMEEDGTVSLEYYNKDCKTAHHNLPPKAKYALFRLYDYNPIEEAVKDFIESKIEENGD